MPITKEQALDILEKFDFFQGQRAGRELWNDKPFDVQEEDIANFSRDIVLLKDFINTIDVVPKSEVEELICKLECILCHVTGGRLSKHTYDLATMETVATDCINETYNDGYGEGYKDCATEIFEEIERLLREHSDYEILCDGKSLWYYEESLGKDIAELKKKYQEGE